MIDRRTKNAEIFRDTEQRYSTDQVLQEAIETSIEKQTFISEESIIRIPAPSVDILRSLKNDGK